MVPHLCALLLGSWACAGKAPPSEAAPTEAVPAEAARFVGTELQTGVSARLQAISVVDENVVWATGVAGTVLRSVDAGGSWQARPVPGATELQFRDVHAFDAERVFLLSAGQGGASRIYRTDDGGASWQLQYQVVEEAGFLNCFDFWSEHTGIAYGDSVDGRLYLLRTVDAGRHWARVEALPEAGVGEGGFAASGTCVLAASQGRAFVGTGAGGNARVLRSQDRGQSFVASETPMPRSSAAGIMSVLEVEGSLLIFGGDLNTPDAKSAALARSEDDGQRFELGLAPAIRGAIYGAAAHGATVVAVGPKGVGLSFDGARSWSMLDEGDFWSVAFAHGGRFFLVGPEGRVKRYDAH